MATNLSTLSVSALAAALSSVKPGTLLAAFAMTQKSGDSVDGEAFVNTLNDLAPSSVDVANATLAETRAIDILVRREVSRMVLAALTANAAKGDKASGASRADIEASLLKTLVTQQVNSGVGTGELDFKYLTDMIDSALDRCIASKQDDGTLTHNAPFVSGKGKGGVKPNGVSASVLAAKYEAEYQAFVKEQAEQDESQDSTSDESQDETSDAQDDSSASLG